MTTTTSSSPRESAHKPLFIEQHGVNVPNAGATMITAQTDAPLQAPACTICHQSDQVRTIQAAFDAGLEDLAPPAMPVGNARMAPWIIAGFVIYLAGNVYLFIELGANSAD